MRCCGADWSMVAYTLYGIVFRRRSRAKCFGTVFAKVSFTLPKTVDLRRRRRRQRATMTYHTHRQISHLHESSEKDSAHCAALATFLSTGTTWGQVRPVLFEQNKNKLQNINAEFAYSCLSPIRSLMCTHFYSQTAHLFVGACFVCTNDAASNAM